MEDKMKIAGKYLLLAVSIASISQGTFSTPSTHMSDMPATKAPVSTKSSSIQSSSTTSTATTTAWNCSGKNLENTAVKEGVASTFKRLYNGQWQVAPASVIFSPLRNITGSDGHLNAEFFGTYAVNRSNLTIFNSTLAPQGSMPYSTAGLYILRYYKPNCTIAANLIVIRSGPVCSCNAINPNNVTLSCSVFYNQSPIQPNNPVFTWTKSGGVQVKEQKPISSPIERYLLRSMSHLSISSNDATTYECQLTFSAPSKAPFTYINMKAPSFKESCSVSCV